MSLALVKMLPVRPHVDVADCALTYAVNRRDLSLAQALAQKVADFVDLAFGKAGTRRSFASERIGKAVRVGVSNILGLADPLKIFDAAVQFISVNMINGSPVAGAKKGLCDDAVDMRRFSPVPICEVNGRIAVRRRGHSENSSAQPLCEPAHVPGCARFALSNSIKRPDQACRRYLIDAFVSNNIAPFFHDGEPSRSGALKQGGGACH